MTQKQIADVLDVQQTTVSRRLMQMHTPDQHSPNLNKDAELTLQLRAEEAEKRCQGFKSESERSILAINILYQTSPRPEKPLPLISGEGVFNLTFIALFE
jgi:predicted transcriptional regulator